MIGRFVGNLVGALVTFALLWFNHLDATAWAIAAGVGAIVAFLWPGVVGWYVAGRARSRREEEIEMEVQRRVARQTDDAVR